MRRRLALRDESQAGEEVSERPVHGGLRGLLEIGRLARAPHVLESDRLHVAEHPVVGDAGRYAVDEREAAFVVTQAAEREGLAADRLDAVGIERSGPSRRTRGRLRIGVVEGIEARLEMPVDPVAERLSLAPRGSRADCRRRGRRGP